MCSRSSGGKNTSSWPFRILTEAAKPELARRLRISIYIYIILYIYIYSIYIRTYIHIYIYEKPLQRFLRCRQPALLQVNAGQMLLPKP